MQLKNRYYPYPILSSNSNDYIDSLFKTSVEQKIDGYNIRLKITTVLQNKQLEEMVDNGSIIIVHHIECGQTCFRKYFETSKYEEDIIITDTDVNGKIQLCTLLVVKNKIEQYENEKFSDELKGFKFNFDKGLIIGIANQYDIIIDKIKDDLAKTSSIISIVPNGDEKDLEMKFELNNDKIIVLLPTNLYKKYVASSSNTALQPLMHSMIIVPILTAVLAEIKCTDESASFKDKRWYTNLKKTCKSLDISLEENDLDDLDPFKVAQTLLNNPLHKSFEYLSMDGENYEY